MIVKYKLTEEDAIKANGSGSGNLAAAGDYFPLLVTKDWGNGQLNGRVFVDGTAILWVTSASQGDELGQWCFE